MAILTLLAGGLALLTGALSYKATKDAQKAAKKAADAMAGVLVNKESNVEPIPVIYGERRVGGTRVFVEASGSEKNKYLYICLVLCEGQIEDITDIKIDDYDLTGGRYGNISITDYGDVIVFESTQQDWVYIDAYKGSDGQGVSTILQSSGTKWTTNHKLSGIAYLGIRLRWDPDIFSGMPDITCVVKGKKVYDPRTQTTAWSDNPALCLRDYLTNSRYGKGLPASAIDDVRFSAAATDCDTFEVTPYTGAPSDIRIFRTNAVLDTGEEIFRNVERLLLGCRGFLPYSNGKYGLVIDQAVTPDGLLTIDRIIGGISIQGEDKKEKFNRVIVKFPNPNADWQPDQAIWPPAGSQTETDFLLEDGGTELIEEIDMETVTDYYAARDFARILCLRSRNALRCSVIATSEWMNAVVGYVIYVTHPTPGWTAKPFQVEELTLNYDGTVKLDLIEYDASLYDYDPANEEGAYPDTELPDPSIVAPPSNLSVVSSTYLAVDGTVIPSLIISWDAANDEFVDQYEVQYKVQSYPDTQWQSVKTPQLTIEVAILRENIVYDIRVRSINSAGFFSDFISTTSTAQGDTTPPSVPTALAASGGFKQITISWVNPTETDFKHVEIHQATTLGGTYTLLGVSSSESFVHYIDGFGIDRFYKVRSVDFSGNISAFTAPVGGETEFVDSDSFTQSVQDLFTQAGLYGIEPVATLPASGDFEGQVVYLTTDNKLYRWTGSGWIASIPAVDITGQLTNAQIADIEAAKLTGQITETQITDGSISTPKLEAGAVTAAKIAANTITAAEIAANTITATQIASGTITATQIAGSTITGNKIAANTITGGLIAASGIITSAAQINNAVITNAKIANLAISEAKIQDAAVDTLKIAGNAVTIPEGDSGPISKTVGLTYTQIGNSVRLSWTGGEQPEAIIVVAGCGTTGGSATQTFNLEIRRVYGSGSYNGQSVGQTFLQNTGGSVVLGAYFTVASTAYSYIDVKLFAKVSTGTKPVENYFIAVLGSKR